MSNVGRNIRQQRLQKKMTQDELAEKLFTTRQTISNYENGKSKPDIDTLVRLSELLGTDASTLIYGPPVPPDRKAAQKKTVVMVFCAVAAGITLRYLTGYAVRIERTLYQMIPIFLCRLVLLPAYCSLIGAVLMQCISLMTEVRHLSGRSGRWIHGILMGFFLCYDLICIVLLLSMCFQSDLSAFVPDRLLLLFAMLMSSWNRIFLFLFLIGGIGLWLSHSREEKKKNNQVVSQS